MIEQILRRPVSVAVATVAMCALGVMSLLELPLSLLPSIERPKLVIEAQANAASRDELLHEVTGPIERRLSSVPGITSIESETSDGLARIEIGSAWQTDPDRLRIDVARRIEGATTLPLDDLTIDVAGSDVSPVIEVAVSGASGATRTRLAERVVLPELARIEGAGKIDVIGARPLRAVVQPRAAALIARNLTALDVEERLRTAGTAVSAGRVREGASVRPLVVTQPIRSVEDLRALRVKGVPLGEIAEVSLREVPDDTAFRTRSASRAQTRDHRSSRAAAAQGGDRPDGSADAASSRGINSEAVLLQVHRAPNANAVALARDVRERVRELRTRGIDISVVSDHSAEVTRALAELGLAALLGVLLGTLVLRYMLGVWRPTLALAVVVPAALLASFSAFYFAGIQLDVISLAGLALATGLLVDNSIVVLESIESARAAGKHNAVAAGTRQIVRAVVASSVTLMIVFAPLLYLRGLARALFGEQAVAVVASVAASLLLSLTLTPVLAQRDETATRPRSPGLASYLRMLGRVSERPVRALLIAAVLTIASFLLGALLPRELFARGGDERVIIDARLAPDLDPAAARALGQQLWNAVPAARMTQRGSEITLETNDIRATPQVAGVRTTVRRKPSAFIEAISGDADRVELIASAATEGEADALAGRIDQDMRRAGFTRVDAELTRGRAAMLLRWNDTLVGADRRLVERQVRAALGSIDVGQTEIPRAEPAILLQPALPGELSLVPVRSGDRVVPLSALSGVKLAERTPLAVRDQGRPAHRLAYRGGQAILPALQTQGSERIRVAGHARELADAFGQMRVAFLLAAILLYLTVAAFYESLALPLLVMSALPFAGAGALVALLATGQSLNVMSLIGLVFLGGVVVNHTVVLIDRAEQLRKTGVAAREAIREAAADRYRPVIMTTVTSILGMLPLAILGGPGVELRRAVAVAVTGGLITATIGTLLVIPLLYRLLDRRSMRADEVPEAEVAVA